MLNGFSAPESRNFTLKRASKTNPDVARTVVERRRNRATAEDVAVAVEEGEEGGGMVKTERELPTIMFATLTSAENAIVGKDAVSLILSPKILRKCQSRNY